VADEPPRGRLGELVNGLAWLACLLGLLMIVTGLTRGIFGFFDGRKLANPHLCGDGVDRDCLQGHDGRVVSVGSGNVVHVIYDDGAANVRFALRGSARPKPRAFVRVELWGGQPVSFTDGRGHRYKDDILWPAGYPSWAFVVLVLGAVLITPVTARKVLRVRRSRRR
jgi:hypothetical protein